MCLFLQIFTRASWHSSKIVEIHHHHNIIVMYSDDIGDFPSDPLEHGTYSIASITFVHIFYCLIIDKQQLQ